MTAHLTEPSRSTPIADVADVVVCGAGPAGIAAAIAAARTGAKTRLLEVHGCLGGVWTAGALSWIIEATRTGIMGEIIEALDRRGARADGAQVNFGYDVEVMKLVLEEMVRDAGISVQLHTRVVGVDRDATNRITTVITESKSGRQAWQGAVFIDTTGDGDVAAQAGCRFDYGHPDTGQTQPMTLMALVTGIQLDQVHPFVAGGAWPRTGAAHNARTRFRNGRDALLYELRRSGLEPSYQGPSLWSIYDDLFALMANHEYGVSALDANAITHATINARAEIHRLISGLRTLGGVWSQIRLVATSAQIGVREGRRIHGRYHITVDDLRNGTQHHDAVCRITSGADVHALTRAEGGFLSPTTAPLQDSATAAQEVAPIQPYDIPLRALIARDIDGLLMAGRCISGDFLAHASYRPTGYAVVMGQAAGTAAALAAATGALPHELPWSKVKTAIDKLAGTQHPRHAITPQPVG
ncbi:FAD-dependent oxidoreductase [Phytohabitans kaempferiae]|uniref:FAD-dependent oxidoreductase n=1 Tax=Phytohabitans kaempferiae TaxID=1620943 RepID=A0ABV6M268_9ACTN